MGLFDTYFSAEPNKENYNDLVQIQMKNGPCILKDYWPGCDADIPNGVYISHDGIIVISSGKVITVTNIFTDKWGREYKVTPEFESKLWKLFKEEYYVQ